jgi:hypothetical protein
MTTPGLMAIVRFDADLAGSGKLPAALPAGIRADGDQLRIDNLLRTEWRGVLGALSGGILRLAVPTSFGLTVIGCDSPQDLLASDGVVAAVVSGDGNAMVDCLNPRTDFVSEVPAPCAAAVRLDRPLDMQQHPRHSITHVGANLVLAERFLDRLGWNTLGQSYPIHVKGRPTAGYCRWLPDAASDLLAPMCRKECLCWRCGKSLDAPLGIWLACKLAAEFPAVCANCPGFGHSQSESPIVLSLEMAAQVVRTIGPQGYELEPVFATDSLVARTAAEFVRCVEPFRNLSR